MNRRAFTLVEVLLVSAMFTLISLAVFNAFSNGFKLWARGQRVMVEGDTAIFLSRISEDLRQTVPISGIPFKGSSMELSFPAVIWAPADPMGSRSQEGITDQIGAVRYVYDSAQKKILRYQAVYGQALRSQWQDPVTVADLVDDITLRYYVKGEHGLDARSQLDEGLPLGVMIDVQYSLNGQPYHMRRFLIVPAGGGI